MWTFRHDPAVWEAVPSLRAVALATDISGTTDDDVVSKRCAEHTRHALARLDDVREGELAPIQAWRRVFAGMGVRPTQYRCAAESLLRRLRTHGSLPRIHPLVDLCNAISTRFGVPIAVLDAEKIIGDLTVRRAEGHETYLAFDRTVEHPQAGEIVYADAAGQAHSRRWCHRQSDLSAVGTATRRVLVVAEAVHDDAVDDLEVLAGHLRGDLAELWSDDPPWALLTPERTSFSLPARQQA